MRVGVLANCFQPRSLVAEEVKTTTVNQSQTLTHKHQLLLGQNFIGQALKKESVSELK